MSHHAALFAAYAVAALLWLAVERRSPSLWPACALPAFARPGRELLAALLAVLAILGLGQLYQHGVRLPTAAGGTAAVLAESLNQLLIFSPVWALLAWRRHGLSTLLLPRRRLWLRLLLSALLAAIALAVFGCVRAGAPPLREAFAKVLQPANVRILAQVAMEDLAIAMLLVRTAAVLGSVPLTAALVGALFAAGHVPALLAGSADLADLAALPLDALLAAGVSLCLLRGRDVSWFVGVHFALDMTQFLPAPR